MLAWSSALEEFALFRTLSSEQRLKTLNAMVRQDLVRGQMLVAQGGPSDSLFLVLHGALAVRKTGYLEPIAELRAGELVGEIGFFADVPRTADVIAIRDTSVLALTRPTPIACKRCFLAARSTRMKSPNGSTGSNTPRRWWFISAAATLRPGRARPSVRPTWSCSRAAGMRLPQH